MIVRVEAHPGSAFETVRREFPSLELSPIGGTDPASLAVSEEEWQSERFDFYRFDDDVDRAAERTRATLRISGTPEFVESEAIAILTRCQRAIDRRNELSLDPIFDRTLVRLASVYDLDKPLGLADFRHARDTWQWVLRLDTRATLEAQLAALLHDVERSISEADRRIEHHARDYVAFKEEHARRGAALVRRLLSELDAPASVVDRVADLVRDHERPGADRDRALVNEADALSFFSLNSGGFLDYFGAEHTRRKVRYTLDRLGREGRARLGTIRLRRDVRAIVAEVLA